MKYLLITFGLSSTVASAQNIWNASQNCVRSFGFYTACENMLVDLSLPEVEGVGPLHDLPLNTSIIFNASCPRYTGKAPLLSLTIGSTHFKAGFSQDPLLQVIEISKQESSSVHFEIEFDKNSEFHPDCQVQYFGAVSIPIANFVERIGFDLLAQREDRLLLLEKFNNLDDIFLSGKAEFLKQLPSELARSARRQETLCMQNVIQVSRRTQKPIELRTSEDTILVTILAGPDWADFVGGVDEKAVCNPGDKFDELPQIHGLIEKQRSDFMNLLTLERTLAESLNSASSCPDLEGCLPLKDLKKSLEGESLVVAERSDSFYQSLQIYTDASGRQIKSLQDSLQFQTFGAWTDLQNKLMGNLETIKAILKEGAPKP